MCDHKFCVITSSVLATSFWCSGEEEWEGGGEDDCEGGVGDGLSIYLWGGEGWGPVKEEGGITLDQGDSKALVQVSDLVRFFLPSVPGQG